MKMKTMQKISAILSALMVTVSMSTLCEFAPDDTTNKQAIDIIVEEYDCIDREEQNCHPDCDQPVEDNDDNEF